MVFEEAVVACDMPESCEFLSLDGWQKMFLRTLKGVDLAPHPVVGLVLQIGETGKFPHTLGFENWFLFTKSASRVNVSQP